MSNGSLRSRLGRLPLIDETRAFVAARRSQRDGTVRLAFPDGHFYSPIPSLRDVAAREPKIFSLPDSLGGIDLQVSQQLELVNSLATYAEDQPFSAEPTPGYRYYFENAFFSYGDAIALHCILRWLKPSRIVEVGSGFSSALILDTRDLFLQDSPLSCTFVEPYPERLETLLTERDEHCVQLERRRVQDGPVEPFTSLSAGDVLFIDSTHVSKVGSDVNFLLFEVLPQLKPGVVIHIHDVFYPFEYPASWIYEGRAWNEAYLLRAFLTHNASFEILWWNDYLAKKHFDAVSCRIPLWHRNTGGSIWLRKTL